MKRILILSYVLMGVAVVLAALLAWRYQAISATVKRQQKEIATNSEILRERERVIHTQLVDLSTNARLLEENKARLVAAQSASSYIEGGSYGMMDLGTKFKSLCDQNIDHSSVIEFCASHRMFIDLMRLLSEALQARISAVNSVSNRDMRAKYENMRAKYRAILQALDGSQETPFKASWRALAEEGVAYASMKLGHLSEAQTLIRDAVESNPNDGGAGVTALKIMCVRRRPANRVRVEFSALLRRLDARVAATPPGNEDGRNARLERELFPRDAELYHLCGYANLRRPSRARGRG